VAHLWPIHGPIVARDYLPSTVFDLRVHGPGLPIRVLLEA